MSVCISVVRFQLQSLWTAGLGDRSRACSGCHCCAHGAALARCLPGHSGTWPSDGASVPLLERVSQARKDDLAVSSGEVELSEIVILNPQLLFVYPIPR